MACVNLSFSIFTTATIQGFITGDKIIQIGPLLHRAVTHIAACIFLICQIDVTLVVER